jgi:hypothetical protein
MRHVAAAHRDARLTALSMDRWGRACGPSGFRAARRLRRVSSRAARSFQPAIGLSDKHQFQLSGVSDARIRALNRAAHQCRPLYALPVPGMQGFPHRALQSPRSEITYRPSTFGRTIGPYRLRFRAHVQTVSKHR